MIKQQTEIRLVGEGKYWGTLRIEQGRLLLDCQRHGRQVQFDLLATVQRGQPVTGDDVLVRHCVDDATDSRLQTDD